MLDGKVMNDAICEVYDRYPVAAVEVSPDALGGLSRDVYPVARTHRARGIEHDRNVDLPVLVACLRRLEGDADQALAAIQRMSERVGGYGEAVGVQGRIVVVVERVDPLFRPHRVRLHLVACSGPVQREVIGSTVDI